MTTKKESSESEEKTSVDKQGWNHIPDAPVELSPLFNKPPTIVKSIKWLGRGWVVISVRTLVLAISILTWLYWQPELARAETFQLSWITEIYLRNLVLMIVVAGGLHLWLYRFKKQGDNQRFDKRDLSKSGSRFTFGNQVRDNMFWTLASGVTVWTGFEVFTFWGYANGYVPYLMWSDNPVWFVLLFVLQPIWGSFHFYWIHRALHWPPIYRLAHSLHHRNINVGPWSGMAMHPVEHLLYLSAGMIHWVVASHPVHFLFNMQVKALEASTSHAGYQRLILSHRFRVDLGDFFHQLHHRFFECNYGTLEMPWDRWFGTFHSGTPEDREKMNLRRKEIHS